MMESTGGRIGHCRAGGSASPSRRAGSALAKDHRRDEAYWSDALAAMLVAGRIPAAQLDLEAAYRCILAALQTDGML
jgi:hypothetical protein